MAKKPMQYTGSKQLTMGHDGIVHSNSDEAIETRDEAISGAERVSMLGKGSDVFE